MIATTKSYIKLFEQQPKAKILKPNKIKVAIYKEQQCFRYFNSLLTKINIK